MDYNYYITKLTKSQAEKVENEKIKEWKKTKYINQGDIIDVTKMSFVPSCSIKKLANQNYVNIKTGEVSEMKSTDKQGNRNVHSLRKIFRELRQLITTNFSNAERNKQMFLTITYQENMQDEKKAKKDFELFWRKFKRLYKDHELAYISIIEPQARGAWHFHVLVKSDKEFDLSDCQEIGKKLYKMWEEKGYITVEPLNSIDNVGAYFIAYLSNTEISADDEEKYKNDIIEKDGKKYIKGDRLKYYPEYMQIYRHSKNIDKPEVSDYMQIENEMYNITYEQLIELMRKEDTEGLYIKKIQLKRKEGKK